MLAHSMNSNCFGTRWAHAASTIQLHTLKLTSGLCWEKKTSIEEKKNCCKREKKHVEGEEENRGRKKNIERKYVKREKRKKSGEKKNK